MCILDLQVYYLTFGGIKMDFVECVYLTRQFKSLHSRNLSASFTILSAKTFYHYLHYFKNI